jgi:hypothetical protein
LWKHPAVGKVTKRRPPRDARLEAMQLLGKWASLARGHVLVGGSCSCGLAGGNLRVEGFEQQILDFLATKYGAAGNAGVTRLLRECAGYEPARAGSLAALLRAIAARPDAPQWLALLGDLKRTLDSFDELHRGPGL